MRKPEKIMLSAEEKAALLKIAEKAGCKARCGPTAGQPSFRVMLQMMAEGRFVLYDKLKPREKKKRRGATAVPGAPAWWRPFYGNAVGREYALKKASREELLALGLRFEINPMLKTPDIVVGKPEWPAPFVPTRPHWWWSPRNGKMTVADAVEQSGLTVDAMIAGGMVVEDGFVRPAADWHGWTLSEPPVVRDELAKMPVPDWFVRCPGMMAMVLVDAVGASGMSPGEMKAAGMVIRKVSGFDVVSGPAGSEWAYEVPIETLP